VYRWDLATGRVSSIVTPAGLATAGIGWAADSQEYAALVLTADTVTKGTGVLQYLHPDGSLGRQVPLEVAGYVGGPSSYSPSLRYVVTWPTAPAQPRCAVLEVATGRLVSRLAAGATPVGWYDERTVVVRSTAVDGKSPTLDLVSVATGRPVRSIPLTGLPQNIRFEIYSSTGLPPAYASLGF